jgi:hypothetical protein
VVAITHTPHTTKSPRSGRDTSTSSQSARTLPCPFALRPVGVYEYSFRPSHPARTIAVAFPCARPDLIPLNGPTSFPRNGPRRPTAVASGNLSFRLGFAMQLRARAQGDGGSPHAVLALYLQNGICANQGRVLRMVFSSVPIRHRIWSPESGFSRSRPAADAVSNDGRDGAV